MDGSCNQCAVGSQHKASHFGKDGNIAHACRCQNFFVYPSYPFADCHDVTFKFIGFVRNADPTGKIDKCNMNIQLVFQLHSQFKNNLRQHRIIIIGFCIACQKGVNSKVLCALFLQQLEGFLQLFLCHAVFCITWVVHNAVAYLKYITGVITAGNRFRNFCKLFKKRNMGNIIKVDDCAQLCRFDEILRRGYVGGKHNILSLLPNSIRQQQLCVRGAVRTAPLLLQNLQDSGCGGCLYRKIFSEPFIPGKCGIYLPRIFADTLFIVNMEGCRVCFDDFLRLF